MLRRRVLRARVCTLQARVDLHERGPDGPRVRDHARAVQLPVERRRRRVGEELGAANAAAEAAVQMRGQKE